jgi:hypothetical protein
MTHDREGLVCHTSAITGNNPSDKFRRNLELTNKKGRVEGKDDLINGLCSACLYMYCLIRTLVYTRVHIQKELISDLKSFL